MTNSFEQLLKERGGFRTQTAIRILPPRVKVSGPRTGTQLDAVARSAGDRWYFNALPLRTFIYSKLDERYAALPKDHKYTQRKLALMAEAKGILNEHRNQIVEAVLPLFDVRLRDPKNSYADGEELTEPDTHARDYFVRNVFHMYVETYKAWLTEFCSDEQLATAETTLMRLSEVQREKLERELRSYQFGFRVVKAPR